jgi:hypothetical protein
MENNINQEGWLAKHAVSDEDKQRLAETEEQVDAPEDPMTGLEGLDVAGPKLA